MGIERSENKKFCIVTSNHDPDYRAYWFECPGCKQPHVIPVSGSDPNGKYWGFNEDMIKPTFTPSLLVYDINPDGARRTLCHLFLRDGVIEFLNDCAHEFKGKKVPLTECPDV